MTVVDLLLLAAHDIADSSGRIQIHTRLVVSCWALLQSAASVSRCHKRSRHHVNLQTLRPRCCCCLSRCPRRLYPCRRCRHSSWRQRQRGHHLGPSPGDRSCLPHCLRRRRRLLCLRLLRHRRHRLPRRLLYLHNPWCRHLGRSNKLELGSCHPWWQVIEVDRCGESPTLGFNNAGLPRATWRPVNGVFPGEGGGVIEKGGELAGEVGGDGEVDCRGFVEVGCESGVGKTAEDYAWHMSRRIGKVCVRRICGQRNRRTEEICRGRLLGDVSKGGNDG